MQRRPSVSLSVLLACSFLVSCNAKNSDTAEAVLAPPTDAPISNSNHSILFTALDELVFPAQTSVYRMNLADKNIERVLAGESSDPVIFLSGNEALMFNRAADSKNYRRLPWLQDGLKIGSQRGFAGGGATDPHDALYLGDDKVLLAHPSTHNLTLMRQSTGEELATVSANWDLPQGVSAKPEQLVSAKHGDKTYVYMSHQAFDIIDTKVGVNGSQQIFVFEWDHDSQLKIIDLDPNREKVQGIKLRGSFPMLLNRNRSKPLYVSLCSELVAVGTDPNSVCHAAVEELDPDTNTVSVLWDLDDAGLLMNGPVTAGPDEQTFFANIVRKDSGAREVVQLSLKNKTVVTVHSFSNYYGFWATFFDATTQTLYVGDQGVDGAVGQFTVINREGNAILPLPGVPYNGVFLPSYVN